MPAVTSRSEFEKLIEFRLRAAKLLLAHQEWDGAYYLAGYAIEYAFKIRIIARLMATDSFPERKHADNYYKHDLAVLRALTGRDSEMASDPTVNAAWDIIKDWSEQTRYATGRPQSDAELLVDAVEIGVQWIRSRS